MIMRTRALPSTLPFALSLSKGLLSCLKTESEGKGFDRLSPNGHWGLDRG
jgi:hypothetical protein